MEKRMSEELIERIKKCNYEKPDFIVEDLQTLDFKEKNGSLIIDYSYQRNFIQTVTNASKYIESVLLGLIIPEIQVFENRAKGHREIIDGQQRILSLLKFLRNEYRLKGLKYLTVFNGKKFKDLPEEIQNIYRQFCVNMRVAKNSSDDYKYLLFERLNLGSKDLNQQEIRNCVFKDNPILQMARMITNQESIVRLIENVGRIKNDRYARDEFIIELFAARYGELSDTNKIQKDRINEYLMSTNDILSKDAQDMFTEFFNIVELINEHYDLENLVLDIRQRKSMLEAIVVAMWSVSDTKKLVEHSDRIKVSLLKVLSSQEFKVTTELGGAQGNKMVRARIHMVLDEINKIIA